MTTPPEIPSSQPSAEELAAENQALRQRLDELESRLSQARTPHRRPPLAHLETAIPGLRPPTVIVVLLCLLLGAILPVLTLLDRWVGLDALRYMSRNEWCKVEFLCKTALPPYFVYTFASFFLLLVLAGWLVKTYRVEAYQGLTSIVAPGEPGSRQRRWAWGLLAAGGLLYLLVFLASLRQNNSLPGWGLLVAILVLLAGRVLQEIPLSELWAFLKCNALPASAVLLSQVALALFLSAYHTPGRWGWAYALLLVLGLTYLFWQRRRVSPAVWLVMLATALFCIRIGSWQYAIVGDEYSFYSMAKAFLEHDSNEMWRRLFDGTGVYGSHPFISSILQSGSMAFLGKDNFGWRFSSLYLAAASVYFFYAFFKVFLNQRIALITAVLLAVSQYLMNFSKIGYNNLQALFVQGLALWAVGYALKNQRPMAFTLAGAALGLCFYVYPAALYAVPLPILLMLLYLPPRSHPSLHRWGQLLLGLALFLLPLLIQPVYWQTKLAGTSFNNPDISASTGSLVFHFVSNMLYALFAYGYAVDQTHFVVSSYLDPLSAVFVPLGIGLLLPALRRQRFALFILLTFVIELVLVGASHDRATPSTTRMFMLLPWWALFAAISLDWVLAQLSAFFTGKHTARLVLAGVLALAGIVNLYQAYAVTRQINTGTPNLELLFLRMLQADQRADPDYPKTYLFITQPDWGIDGIRVLQDVYDVPGSQAQLLRLAVNASGLPEDARLRIKEESLLVVVQPWMAEDLRTQVEADLAALGKQPCPVSDTPLTEPRFTLWYSSALENLCQIANSP